jgi:hypothetical protein
MAPLQDVITAHDWAESAPDGELSLLLLGPVGGPAGRSKQGRQAPNLDHPTEAGDQWRNCTSELPAPLRLERTKLVAPPSTVAHLLLAPDGREPPFNFLLTTVLESSSITLPCRSDSGG